MKGGRLIASGLAVLLMGSALAVAADEAKPEKEHKGRLIKPYSELTDLTADQKTKIEEIHGKALEEEKAIREKEKEEVMAVLTDAQKTELKEIEEKTGETHKGHHAGSTTKPSDAK